MSRRKTLDIPLNRTEGDLELRVEVHDNIVVDAWSRGTMYRGFENMLLGRGALDGLVVTPRICGICTTTHLMAAAKALDAVAGVTPPDNARRLRNLALMTEHVQSDLRQALLMFMADFANPAHKGLALYDEAVARYAPLRGTSAVEAIRQTKKILEIIAVIGGQWPHASFMIPGGVTHRPGAVEILNCRMVLRRFRQWYEDQILGCSIERWREVASAADLEAWLDASEAHRDGDVGFFIRFAGAIGLDAVGAGHGTFLSFGSLDMPDATAVPGRGATLLPAGFAAGIEVQPFDGAAVAEHCGHSWFEGAAHPQHPFASQTVPYASGEEQDRYSWIKAPRYRERPAETGPLAEAVVAGDPLFRDLIAAAGPNALARQLARLVRPATLLPAMETWLDELAADDNGGHYQSVASMPDGEGAGLIEAARGALGHWVRIRDGRIAHYQIITPTSWNASPRDDAGVRGPWEEALIGCEVRDAGNPVELGYVVRSFDPCLVCSVHTLEGGRSRGRVRLGV